MAWIPDGDKRVIYEAPPGASYSEDADGYRIYDGGIYNDHAVLTYDVAADVWTPLVDWMAETHGIYYPPMMNAGGRTRPTGEKSSTDFWTVNGYRLQLANFPHQAIFNGNLFPETTQDVLFDTSRLTADGVSPFVNGSANLLTYASGTTEGGTPCDLSELLIEIRKTQRIAEQAAIIAAQRTR